MKAADERTNGEVERLDGKEEEWFPSHKYFIAGTWSNFSPVAMHWDGSNFVHLMAVGSKGWESFQILQGGDWDRTYYPSVRNANPFANWKLRGPDNQGNGKNWTLGVPPDDGCNAKNAAKGGEHYRITVAVDGESLVTEVAWKQLTPQEVKDAPPSSGLRARGPRRVLVLRHGSRPDTVADPPLDALGFRQAEQAAMHFGRDAKKIGVAPITALFCSPFLRALQTAAPVAQALNLPICVEEGFCELLAHQWLHAQDPLPSLGPLREGLPPASLLDGEYRSAVRPSYPDVIGRMRKGDTEGRRRPTKRHRQAIQAALAAAQGGSVLVVGHGATHDFLAEALCPQQHLQVNHTPHCVPHCGITEILEQAGTWHLAAFGSLPWQGEPAREAKLEAERRSKPDDDGPPAAAEPVATPAQAPSKTLAERMAEEDARVRAAAAEALRDQQRLEQEAYEYEQPIWVVVGGATTRGILARSGASLHSRELDRLKTGARVIQLGLKRDRLHYRKLEGDGPEFGWVSIRNKDGELMRREDFMGGA
mmetsp:Transcript_102657/g.306586  ORF Transcript_102657/g.306586 Transcript_102657/m.306586 type:complete len:535 (-) Transcript_102657:86-1690(-)